MKKAELVNGLKEGLPIILGYFFVSIGVGSFAVQNGFTPFQATLMSLCNLTSAGEIAAIKIFGENGGYLELFLSQLIINARYALMAITLSQKNFAPNCKTPHRFLISYGITDEIFAVCINKKDIITLPFLFTLIIGPIIAWSSGTLLGGLCGAILSKDITNAFNILIYAMLISIIIPECKKQKSVLFAVISSALISIGLFFVSKYYIPTLSSGYTIIISSIISASIAALIFPMDIPENKYEENL